MHGKRNRGQKTQGYGGAATTRRPRVGAKGLGAGCQGAALPDAKGWF